ncbi:MAG: ATP-binding protein [Eubacterium sp.]|nr:ATP-binding protein [Eubacterium sp.]
MLIQYSVENYKSIKNEIVINFRADSRYKEDDWVCQGMEGEAGIYKCIGFVGPNASGKTNIIESVFFAFRFIQDTISRKESSGIHRPVFQMDAECSKKPSCFEFIFTQNGTKYAYGFSITDNEVVEEYLLRYLKERSEPYLMFERNAGHQYDFHGNDEKTQTELAGKTNKNRLYLPVAAEWGYEPVKEVYHWFHLECQQYTNFDIPSMINSVVNDSEKKEIFLKELQKADFNITDIYVKKQKLSKRVIEIVDKLVNDFLGSFPVDTADLMTELEEKLDIHIVHKSPFGESMDIALEQDSAGTSAVIENIARLMCADKNGGLILEDELGKNFHTKLTQHFLHMIRNPSVNTGNAQLLFSSHDTKVLNLLNPDQVYLVDKDQEGATCIKLLDDYELYENEDIELGYLDGRFGRIPYMKG